MNIKRQEAYSVSDLDIGVSERQVIGASYRQPKDLEKRVNAYWQGKLILPPQPIWTGDPTNWTADPFEDRNWRFQHHTLRWLNPLRWAAQTGDIKAKNEWVRVARSWFESNVPASVSKSDFAWKDMADGNRAIQLSLGAPLVEDTDTWFVDLLKYHRDWLMDPEHIVTKNHALHQHSGLLVVGAVLRDRQAVLTATKRMTELFETTFDEQGANDEGSAGYHQLNIVWWSQAWDRVKAENVSIPVNVFDTLDKATEVLAHMTMPNGYLPQIGDGARTRTNAGLSDKTDFVISSGAEGKGPVNKTLILDRGYIFFRSGWGEKQRFSEESHTAIRYGEAIRPRTHSHDDRGSVQIYSKGQRWLIDSGFHSYQGKAPENKYLISRDAHNVVSIIGKKHIKGAPVDLVEHEVNKDFRYFKLLDSGYEGIDLFRRVIYFDEPDCWVIADHAVSQERIRLEQNWFVEPGTVARYLDNGFRLDGKAEKFSMFWIGRTESQKLIRANEDSLRGWIGTKWRTLTPGSNISVRSRPGKGELVALFGPYGETPLSIIESRVSSNGHIRLYISRGSSTWRINIGADEIEIKR